MLCHVVLCHVVSCHLVSCCVAYFHVDNKPETPVVTGCLILQNIRKLSYPLQLTPEMLPLHSHEGKRESMTANYLTDMTCL